MLNNWWTDQDIMPDRMPAPTILLYRDNVIQFKNSFREVLTFIELATGLKRPTREQLLRWCVEHDVDMDAVRDWWQSLDWSR